MARCGRGSSLIPIVTPAPSLGDGGIVVFLKHSAMSVDHVS